MKHQQKKKDEELDIQLSQAPLLLADNLNFETIGFDYDSRIYVLSSHADKLDYITAAASGLLCGLVDILWVGEFDIERDQKFTKSKIEALSRKLAEKEGFQDEVKVKGKQGLAAVMSFLALTPQNSEEAVSDSDFHQSEKINLAKTPSISGLVYSLLTQFSGKAYFVGEMGDLIIEDLSPEYGFRGRSTSEKIFIGVVDWLFNLTVNISEEGIKSFSPRLNLIPGPILELAKNLSQIPLFQNLYEKIKTDGDEKLDAFINEMWNRAREKAIWFSDTKAAGIIFEIGKQALPVLANDFIVRAVYFFRRLMIEIKNSPTKDISVLQKIEWEKISPFNNPTIDRMITISSAVFTGLDIADAVAKQFISGKSFFLSINYVGVIKLVFPVKNEIVWALKRRDIKKIKKAFDEVQEFRFANEAYERLTCFDLTIEQTEILFNLEYHKVLNDIDRTDNAKDPVVVLQKKKWLDEWQKNISNCFSDIFQRANIVLHWYSIAELLEQIEKKVPNKIWFSLVLLESMMFTPYYPLEIDTDSKKPELSKKYQKAQQSYDVNAGDVFLCTFFNTSSYHGDDKITAYRTCCNKYYEKLTGDKKRDGVIWFSAFVVTFFINILPMAISNDNFTYQLFNDNESKKESAMESWFTIISGIVNIFGDNKNLVTDNIGALLSIRLNTWMDSIILPYAGISKEEVLLLTIKILVFIEEILIREKQDLDTAEKVSRQYHKTESVFKLQLARMKSYVKENKGDDIEETKIQIKNLEAVIKIMKRGSECMDEMLL